MRQLFFGLVLLLTGISIGFLVGRGRAISLASTGDGMDVRPGAPAVVVADAPAEPSGLTSVSGADVQRHAPRPARSENAPGESATSELGQSLTQLAARFPAPRGERTLTGRVMNGAGEPIANATVVVTGPSGDGRQTRVPTDSSRIGRAFDGADQLDPFALMLAESLIRSLKPAGQAVTDAEGRFSVPSLCVGQFVVQAYAENYVFERSTSDASAPIELVGKPVVSFEFAVADAAGDSPAEATIVVMDKNGRNPRYRWTPNAPTIRVTSKVVTIQAFVGEIIDMGQNQLRADATSSLMTFDSDADGLGPHAVPLTEFPSVSVTVRPGPDAGLPFEPWCDLVRGTQRIKVGQSSGQPFTAFDVTAGRYTIEVGRGDGPPEFSEEIVVGAGKVSREVELGPLDPSRYLVARCVDAAGRPVQDIWYFGVQLETKTEGISTSIRSKARPNGEYWLSLEHGISSSKRTPRRASIKSLTLVASSPSLGDLSQDVDPSAERVDFVFQTPGELLVQVGGALDPGLRLSVERWDSEEERWQRQQQRKKVPGDGSVVFQALSPELVRIVLEHEDGPWGVPLGTAELQLVEGMNKLRLTAPATYDLVVHVPDLADRRFELWAEENGEFTRRANAKVEGDERIAFACLPAGRYRVQYRGRTGAVFAEYTVPCGEVVFEPAPIDGFEVTSVLTGSIAESIGLRAGDVLVSVDHLKPTAADFILEFTSRVLRPEGANLRVRRGGTTIDLPVSPGKPEGKTMLGLGAQFEPLTR